MYEKGKLYVTSCLQAEKAVLHAPQDICAPLGIEVPVGSVIIYLYSQFITHRFEFRWHKVIYNETVGWLFCGLHEPTEESQ